MESVDRPVLRSRAWLLAGGLLALLVLFLATLGIDQPTSRVVVLLVAAGWGGAVLAWALVRSRRQRRRHEDELTAWAAERARHAERLRIARELHDLASHGLGLITVRAAAARTVTGPQADDERTAALADVERAGREATTELRRMLTVLRTPGEEASLRPADTFEQLPGIVESARAGGVVATLDLAADSAVTAGTQLTVCVIVREALANSARHAGPTNARVVVERDEDVVATMVTDEGPRPGWEPHPGAGSGLVGLRERVDALGGTLLAEPAGTGFRLMARIPEGEVEH